MLGLEPCDPTRSVHTVRQPARGTNHSLVSRPQQIVEKEQAVIKTYMPISFICSKKGVIPPPPTNV